jgi:hypothetical protein
MECIWGLTTGSVRSFHLCVKEMKQWEWDWSRMYVWDFQQDLESFVVL